MQAGDREIQALYQALMDRDTDSWDAVWPNWAPRVAGWVRRHPQFRYTGEEVGYFVNRAFEKLWRAVDPAKLATFANPAQLIQYLKLCVHSVILDELRSPMPDSMVQVAASVEEMSVLAAPGPGVEETALRRVRRDQLWRVVAGHVKTDGERAVLEASLVRGLPPREIADRYPGLFASVSEVYRTKRNLLDRLSRDHRLREFLQ